MTRKIKKPILIKVGNHFVNPDDVSSIRQTQARVSNKKLFVVDLKSKPDSPHPIWAQESDIQTLINHFEVLE